MLWSVRVLQAYTKEHVLQWHPVLQSMFLSSRVAQETFEGEKRGKRRKKYKEEPTILRATPSASCDQQEDAHPVALTRGLNTITQYPSVLSTCSLNM